MDSILNMKVCDMTGYSYLCSCGRRHSVDIQRIAVGKGVIKELPEILSDFRDKKIILVSDANTWKIAGERVLQLLEGGGYSQVSTVFLESEDYPTVVPDERVVARLLYETSNDTSLLLAVGSGTINDVCKIVSYKMGIASATVGTAPSMDGYASSMSPLIVNHAKVTYLSHYPYAIVCDSEIMATAPDVMFRAGFGDIVGKYTALADWQLTVKINGEYYCETTARLVRNAVDLCVQEAEAYMKRVPQAIDRMNEALLLSGIAMGLVGISRPASGCEHHMAHFWELDALKKGTEHPLHGNSVGVGSIVACRAYQWMKQRYADLWDISVPEPEYMKALYKKVGSTLTPQELGVPREVFLSCMNNAYRIRPRYTIFNYAKNAGILPELANQLTEDFYGT